MPEMLRVYKVYEVDETAGFAVVAHSAKEAKKLGYYSGQLLSDWVDLRVNWLKGADVTGLTCGVMDTEEAVKRGIFDYAVNVTCDICGKDRTCRYLNKKLVCFDCEEKAENGD